MSAGTLPTVLRYERSMQNNSTTGLQNSGTRTQLQQVLSHLHIQSLGEPTCQVCNEPLGEGDQITVYFSNPAGSSTYCINQCRCSTHNDDLTSLFTLGVSELIVNGRVGLCQDQATQKTWPVLLSPTVRLISGHDTDTGCIPTVNKDKQDSETTEWQYGTTVSDRVTKQSDDRTCARTRTNQRRVYTPQIGTEGHR